MAPRCVIGGDTQRRCQGKGHERWLLGSTLEDSRGADSGNHSLDDDNLE